MKKLLIALSLITLTGGAIAQDGAEFSVADADANGSVSLAEAQIIFPDLTEEEFTVSDTDDNGELSEQEFATLPGAVMAN